MWGCFSEWIPVVLGMELAGLAFGLASVVTLLFLLVLIKVNWLRSRTALVAIIPFSCLAGKKESYDSKRGGVGNVGL